METSYLLPILLLLASTKGIHQELFFQTRVPAQRLSKEECLVLLCVCDGILLSAEIKEGTGQPLLVQPEQALNNVQTLGMLEWYRVPSPAYTLEELHEQQRFLPRSSGFSSRPATEYIPVRRRLNGELPPLDHAHRRVFLLIDGTRGVQQIALLLGKDPEEMMAILQGLQAQGLITFQNIF